MTETSGRGVGLSAIRKEANKLDGDVFIESIEGEGTTITIWFKKYSPSISENQNILDLPLNRVA